MNTLDDWKRIVTKELEGAGFANFDVRTKLDGESKVVVEVSYDGRTAEGVPNHFMSAIDEAKQYKSPLSKAFEVRNLHSTDVI